MERTQLDASRTLRNFGNCWSRNKQAGHL
jgi:hypothetical protein